jgi:hypothetical protein
MRRSSRPARSSAKLSESLLQRLNMYALAASAGGVGLLTSAQPADAKIVYTPANTAIGHNQVLNLDLNHDGITDFQFYNSFYGSLVYRGTLKVFPVRRGNAISGTGASASALRAGALIGPNKRSQPGNNLMAHVFFHCPSACTTTISGPWANVTRRYLGLRFLIRGKTHFGWARLNVTATTRSEVLATLTGYAYETIPYKPIIAGETKSSDEIESNPNLPNSPSVTAPSPGTLGALAMGAPALSIWRRKEWAERAQ